MILSLSTAIALFWSSLILHLSDLYKCTYSLHFIAYVICCFCFFLLGLLKHRTEQWVNKLTSLIFICLGNLPNSCFCGCVWTSFQKVDCPFSFSAVTLKVPFVLHTCTGINRRESIFTLLIPASNREGCFFFGCRAKWTHSDSGLYRRCLFY